MMKGRGKGHFRTNEKRLGTPRYVMNKMYQTATYHTYITMTI